MLRIAIGEVLDVSIVKVSILHCQSLRSHGVTKASTYSQKNLGLDGRLLATEGVRYAMRRGQFSRGTCLSAGKCVLKTCQIQKGQDFERDSTSGI